MSLPSTDGNKKYNTGKLHISGSRKITEFNYSIGCPKPLNLKLTIFNIKLIVSSLSFAHVKFKTQSWFSIWSTFCLRLPVLLNFMLASRAELKFSVPFNVGRGRAPNILTVLLGNNPLREGGVKSVPNHSQTLKLRSSNLQTTIRG